MAGYIKGQSRTQATLFPEVLDDFITEESTVRVIDVFVDELNLESLGFKRAKPEKVGRPGYDPATMLKLYLYGYLNRIQSSRRLEREAQRNVELMWLTRRLAPDFKTIADFRRDNSKGIKNVCRTFIDICRQLNMFKDAVVAVDGSKFKAVNNKSKNYTPGKLKFHIERVEKHIQRYLDKLDASDSSESSESTDSIHKKIADLKSKLQEFNDIKKKVEESPDKQISETDPDSRLMKTRNYERQVCYNVQSVVDTKHHLILAHDVTNVPDRGQLSHMTQKAQKALGKTDIKVIADKGYYSRADIKASLDTGAEALVPKSDTSGTEKAGIFNRSAFKYDREKDLYVCPAGNKLVFSSIVNEGNLEQKVYRNHAACRLCSIRAKCTTSKVAPRKMKRWVHENEIEDMLERYEKAPETTIIRKQTVEHPFGTIKMRMGATHFLTRGFDNVATEMDLNVLAYNLQRMVNIVGAKTLMKQMMA